MRLAFALVAVVATGGSLPKAGVLVPGRSLAGVTVGEPAAQVTSRLGRFYGVCDACSQKTWYFTTGRWQQSGLAVELASGRVTGLFTVWRPEGWRTSAGMALGADQAQVTQLSKSPLTVACPDYTVLVRDTGSIRTAYYIVDGKLWGFGLFRRGANPCR